MENSETNSVTCMFLMLSWAWHLHPQALLSQQWRCAQLEVLNTLEKNDPQNRWHCVHLQEWFDYRGHVCMVCMCVLLQRLQEYLGHQLQSACMYAAHFRVYIIFANACTAVC